jgi:hypothetical protein
MIMKKGRKGRKGRCGRGGLGGRGAGTGDLDVLIGRVLIGTAMAAGGGTQLQDAGGTGEHHEQDTADSGQQQGHAKRKMTVSAEVGNVHGVTVLQDENQQEQQNDREAGDSYPQAADPGAADRELRRPRGSLGRRSLGRRSLGRVSGRRVSVGRIGMGLGILNLGILILDSLRLGNGSRYIARRGGHLAWHALSLCGLLVFEVLLRVPLS